MTVSLESRDGSIRSRGRHFTVPETIHYRDQEPIRIGPQ